MTLPRRTLTIFAALLLAGSTALAEEPAARDQLFFDTFFVGRYNPVGVDAQGTVLYKHRLGDSEDVLWKTRSISASFTGTYNPAEWSFSGAVEYEPIAVFQLRAFAEYRGYPGAYGEIQSSNNPMMPIDDASVAAQSANAYSTDRITLRLEPKFRIGFGPFGFQDVVGLSYGKVRAARITDVAYFDPGAVVMMPVDGFALSNELSAVYLAGPLTAGGVYDVIAPFGIGNGNAVHRLGALVAYSFYDSPRAYLNKPTLFALAEFNLVDRRYTGPIPTVTIGFTTETDLFIKR